MRLSIEGNKVDIDLSKEEWGMLLASAAGLLYALYTNTPLQIEGS